jgi:membrane protease YdiL (CAAX protease family)
VTAPEPVRERRWGLGDVVAGLALGIAASQVALAIVLGATDRTADQVDDLPLSLVLVTQLGLWVGLFGVPWFATRAKGGGLVRDLHLRARWRDLWVGGSLGIVLQLLVLPLLYWPLLELLADRADGAIGVILLVLIVGIGAPIVEEVFYRGLLLGSLRKRGVPTGASVVLTALVFGLSHFELLQLPALVLFGVVAGALAVRYDRLGPAIAAHVGFNMVTVIALLAS